MTYHMTREQAEQLASEDRCYVARPYPDRHGSAPVFKPDPTTWGVWDSHSDHWVFLDQRATINVGAHVRTLVEKDERMIGINVPAGVLGTIVRIEPYNGMCILGIKLDKHFADLDEWNNVLEFYLEGDSEQLSDYVTRI